MCPESHVYLLPQCSYKFINNRASEMEPGREAGRGRASVCARRELGAAVLGVGPGVWFYLGPRLGSFKTTQCNYPDHKMFCKSPAVPDATGKGDARSGPAPAEASPVSAGISLPTQPLDVKVGLTPYIYICQTWGFISHNYLFLSAGGAQLRMDTGIPSLKNVLSSF